MANVPIRQIFGTAQTVINTAVDIPAGNFSGAPAATFDNTTDAAVPYAPWAQAMLEMPDWAAPPIAGAVIELWGVLLESDGAENDTDVPSGAVQNGARYMGQFVMAAVDALQRRTINIRLLGITKMNFYLRNSTTQNANNDAGTACVLKITPFALGTG